MINCTKCVTGNPETAKFCDECGTRLVNEPVAEASPVARHAEPEPPAYVPPATDRAAIASVSEIPRAVSVTETDPSVAVPFSLAEQPTPGNAEPVITSISARLVIERADAPPVEFPIAGSEATIGRWDADNGVFPDVDLDQYDAEAKVSRRHARIRVTNGRYTIEDLGSTNGTYVNRGRRLLPGNPHLIDDNDEVIVGKTFLRFKTNK